jgi:formate dehydrogenase major subunit
MAQQKPRGFFSNLLHRWPAYQDVQQWRQGRPIGQLGLGETAISEHTRGLRARTDAADKVVHSVCPYCAVGCGQLIYVKDGKIIDIEGNPESPVNGGTLCPKGAATFGMLINPARVTTVKYRAPHSDRWEEKPLDWAMERIAQLVKETRDRAYQERDPESGKALSRCPNIASLGGATLDNEENYLIKKLFGAGLGIIWIENQARI